jgi:hypothetical protein
VLLHVDLLEIDDLDLGRSLGRQRETVRDRVDRIDLLGALEQRKADGALLDPSASACFAQ